MDIFSSVFQVGLVL